MQIYRNICDYTIVIRAIYKGRISYVILSNSIFTLNSSNCLYIIDYD